MQGLATVGFALVTTLSGHARAIVYEGFNYPVGPIDIPSMNGGSGWGGGFTGSVYQVGIIAQGSITEPATLPPTGNSVRAGGNYSGVSLARQLAQPVAPSEEVWLSFVARLDEFPSSWWVGFNDANGAFSWQGVGATAVHGIMIARGDGQPQHYTQEVVYGQTSVVVRFGAGVYGQRAIDVWNNPTPGPLGPPLASVVGPAFSLSAISFLLQFDTTLDEFRMGPSLQDVFVPAPNAVGVGLLGVLVLSRRVRSRL